MRRSRLKTFLLYFAPQFSVYTKFGIDPKLRKNAPLLLVRSVSFGNAGQPVYVCMQVINGERFQLIL